MVRSANALNPLNYKPNKEKNMSKGIFATKGTLLGTVAKYAISQSPYAYPENLEIVLSKFNSSIDEDFNKAPLRVFEWSNFEELVNYLSSHLGKIPEYVAWNDRKNGRESEFAFTSAYDSDTNPDDDFIDLDALERNVASEIER